MNQSYIKERCVECHGDIWAYKSKKLTEKGVEVEEEFLEEHSCIIELRERHDTLENSIEELMCKLSEVFNSN